MAETAGNGSCDDIFYMSEALKEARKACEKGEAPVGAVIVRDGQIIARGRNGREAGNDPTLHAEMTAIRKASRSTGSWRLEDCSIYVTLEPCAMCAGAILQARMQRLVYGAPDPKAGAAGSVINVLEAGKFNHNVEVSGGIMEEECSGLLKQFFRELRNMKGRPEADGKG